MTNVSVKNDKIVIKRSQKLEIRIYLVDEGQPELADESNTTACESIFLYSFREDFGATPNTLLFHNKDARLFGRIHRLANKLRNDMVGPLKKFKKDRNAVRQAKKAKIMVDKLVSIPIHYWKITEEQIKELKFYIISLESIQDMNQITEPSWLKIELENAVKRSNEISDDLAAEFIKQLSEDVTYE